MMLRADRTIPSFVWSLAVGVACFATPLTAQTLASPTNLDPPRNGDANNDGHIDIGDVVHILRYLYTGGPPPVPCSETSEGVQNGDVDGDGNINLADVVHLTQTLFGGGPAPVACSPAQSPFRADAFNEDARAIVQAQASAEDRAFLVDVGARFLLPNLTTPIDSPVGRSEVYVQFSRPLRGRERASLVRSGVRFYQSIARTTYLAKVNSRALQALYGHPLIRGVELVEPADKVTAALFYGNVSEHVVNADQTWSVDLRFYEDVSLAHALRVVDSYGVQVGDRSRLLFNERFMARVDAAQIARLATDAAVRSIAEIAPPPREFNVVSQQNSNVDDIQAPPFNLDGTGVVIGMWDGGPVLATHADLTPRVTVVENDQAASGHATHVAGTMISSGANFAAGEGMAPNAGQLFSYDFGDDPATEQDDAVDDNDIVIANHSWGSIIGWDTQGGVTSQTGNQNLFGQYDSVAADWDDLVQDTGLIVVKAAGNDRNDCNPNPPGDCDGTTGADGQQYDTLGTHGNSKNIITVGAVIDVTPTAIAAFSSAGPADDGRIKPDVVATGVNLQSTCDPADAASCPPATDPAGMGGLYDAKSGTSMASPTVAGTTALLVERYRDQYAGADPSPDVVKALLVNTAQDLGRPGPDYLFGHGLLDALAAVNTIDAGAVRIITGSVDQDDVDEYLLAVPGDLGNLRLTLNWIDPEGVAANAANDIVNDLDVEAEDPDGGIWFPFTGPGTVNVTNNATATGPNTIDTVENLQVTAAAQGFWTVRVRGTSVPDGPQNYALVANAPFSLDDEPDLRVNAPLDFNITCEDSFEESRVSIFNIGGADLLVDSVSVVAGALDFSVLDHPTQPFIVRPGSHIDVTVRFAASSPGLKAGTLRIESNDGDEPVLDLEMTGEGGVPDINATLEAGGDFGDVPSDSDRVLTLELLNQGTCDLEIIDVVRIAGGPDFSVGTIPGDDPFPIILGPDAHVGIPLQFKPTVFGPQVATFRVTTDDPDQPTIDIDVAGDSPPPDIGVTGSTDFGVVCPDEQAEKEFHICNFGLSNLEVSSVSFVPPCDDFEIVNNPFPRPVSHDFCVPVTIRYTPTEVGTHTCTIRIVSNDPDTPVIELTVTATTPAPEIGVPDDLAFPATVIQPIAPCVSGLPFPILNSGTCNLTITDVSISVNPDEYSLVALPTMPIVLQTGQIVGAGDFRIAFSPTEVGRSRLGEISITYVSDPVTGDATTVTRSLCGEGVKTGARVVATLGGVPLEAVEKVHLMRINANRNRTAAGLDSIDVVQDVPVEDVVPTLPCPPFDFHREYGTVSNPIQLLPGFYQVSVTAVIDAKRETRTVGFNVDSCDFNGDVDVQF